ncbi:MAG: Aldose 1-epimerase [Myxococcaceae bacterium]|jgi:galactose mutarotase-like enzyme|nr:Aldose 1-epimerase [Myxococcaceae bacterium]
MPLGSAPFSPLETVVLEDASARVVVAPARGGMVTRFDVGDAPVLFLDVASLVDETKNVRGGIPVLFPSPGPLAGDRFTCAGRSGAMKQHGFARQRAWSVVGSKRGEVTLELLSDDATRAEFPWDFSARLRYALAGTTLTIETRIENTARGAGAAPMPFALGFHPYFHVADATKANARIPTQATRAFDNVTKKLVDLTGPIDLTVKEVDLHLVDHAAHSATLERGTDRIVVTADPELGRWVIWTLAGKDFVCLEPWTAPANALNTGDGLLTLAPGASRTLTVSIAQI